MTDWHKHETGFVGRWSRLKRKAARDAASRTGDAAGSPHEESIRDLEASEMLANREAAEAVDLGSLGINSDFSVFMKKGVPAALRRKAIRKLWSTSPVFANLDGLNDYEQNPSGKVMGDIRSLWQVGRGYVAQVEALRPDNAETGDEDGQGKGVEAEMPPDAAEDQPGAVVSERQARNGDAPRAYEDAEDEPAKRVSLRWRIFGPGQ